MLIHDFHGAKGIFSPPSATTLACSGGPAVRHHPDARDAGLGRRVVRNPLTTRLCAWPARLGRLRLFLPLLLVSLVPPPVSAAWTISIEDGGTGDQARTVAVVQAGSGARLEVFRDGKQVIHAALILGEGFDVFAEDICPTLAIDQRRPVNMSSADNPCRVSGHRVRFAIGPVQESTITSPLLLQLMNGKTAVLRYQLRNGGYGEAAFSLQRSKQALVEAIGPGVTVLAR